MYPREVRTAEKKKVRRSLLLRGSQDNFSRNLSRSSPTTTTSTTAPDFSSRDSTASATATAIPIASLPNQGRGRVQSQHQRRRRLANGAAVGLGVTALLLALTLLGLGWWYRRRESGRAGLGRNPLVRNRRAPAQSRASSRQQQQQSVEASRQPSAGVPESPTERTDDASVDGPDSGLNKELSKKWDWVQTDEDDDDEKKEDVGGTGRDGDGRNNDGARGDNDDGNNGGGRGGSPRAYWDAVRGRFAEAYKMIKEGDDEEQGGGGAASGKVGEDSDGVRLASPAGLGSGQDDMTDVEGELRERRNKEALRIGAVGTDTDSSYRSYGTDHDSSDDERREENEDSDASSSSEDEFSFSNLGQGRTKDSSFDLVFESQHGGGAGGGGVETDAVPGGRKSGSTASSSSSSSSSSRHYQYADAEAGRVSLGSSQPRDVPSSHAQVPRSVMAGAERRRISPRHAHHDADRCTIKGDNGQNLKSAIYGEEAAKEALGLKHNELHPAGECATSASSSSQVRAFNEGGLDVGSASADTRGWDDDDFDRASSTLPDESTADDWEEEARERMELARRKAAAAAAAGGTAAGDVVVGEVGNRTYVSKSLVQ